MRQEFFHLNPGWGPQFLFGSVLDDIPKEFYDGMRGFKGSLSIQIIKGGRAGDIIRTGLPGILIVSEKVMHLLKENAFQSYGTYPVRVACANGGIEGGYYGLVFYGKGGRFLPEFSDVVYGPLGEDGAPQIYESNCLAFDIIEWDGSDLFYIPDFPNMHVVSQKVVDAFNRARITNYDLTLERIVGVDPCEPD